MMNETIHSINWILNCTSFLKCILESPNGPDDMMVWSDQVVAKLPLFWTRSWHFYFFILFWNVDNINITMLLLVELPAALSSLFQLFIVYDTNLTINIFNVWTSGGQSRKAASWSFMVTMEATVLHQIFSSLLEIWIQ